MIVEVLYQAFDNPVPLKDLASLVAIGRKLSLVADPDSPGIQPLIQCFVSGAKRLPSQPFSSLNSPPFTTLPDISQTLLLINFLRNVSECELRANQVLLWAMQLGFVESNTVFSPLSSRLMKLPIAAQFDKNEAVQSPLSFWIVRRVYESLFKPANLFAQFRSLPIDAILEQPPDSVLGYVSYAPPAVAPAAVPPDPDSLSYSHSLALCFLGFFAPDRGFYRTFLGDSCGEHARERLLIGLLFADASAECATALSAFLSAVPPPFESAVSTFVNRDALLNVYLAGSDSESGRALVKHGRSILPLLHPAECVVHEVVDAIFREARGPLDAADLLCAIELFKRVARGETLDPASFESLFRCCYARLTGFFDGDALLRLLFLLGAAPRLAALPVVPARTVEDLAFGVGFTGDEKLISCHIVLLAAQLLREPPSLPEFLDFFQIHLSKAAFRATFPSVSAAAIRGNAARLFAEAVRLSREKKLPIKQFNIPPEDLTLFCVDYIVATGDYALLDAILPLLDANSALLAGCPSLIPGYVAVLLARPVGEAVPLLRRVHDVSDWSAIVYAALGRFAATDPSKAAALLNPLPRRSASTAALLSALLPVRAITPDFLAFLGEVLSRARHLSYQPPRARRAVAVLACGWPEDPPVPEVPTGIWAWPTAAQTCARPAGRGDKRDMPSGRRWICYTCPSTGSSAVCEGCALCCHRGHDLFYVGEQQLSCSCAQQCKCRFVPARAPEQPPARGAAFGQARAAPADAAGYAWHAAAAQPNAGAVRAFARSGGDYSDSSSGACVITTLQQPAVAPASQVIVPTLAQAVDAAAHASAAPTRGFGARVADLPEPSRAGRLASDSWTTAGGWGTGPQPSGGDTGGWASSGSRPPGGDAGGWGTGSRPPGAEARAGWASFGSRPPGGDAGGGWSVAYGQSGAFGIGFGSAKGSSWGAPKPALKAEPEGPVPPGVVCRLIRSLALAEPPPKEALVERATRTPGELLYEPLQEINDSQPCHFKATDFKVVDDAVLTYTERPSYIGFASTSRPICTAGVVGPEKSVLAVCFGDSLRTFSAETRQLLRSQILPFRVFLLSVAHFDAAVVALASLTIIGVFSVDSDGLFEQQQTIDLAALGPSHPLLKVEWVPDRLYQLAVISFTSVHVFDVLASASEPALTFTPTEHINSSIFFTVDDMQYFVMVGQSGRIAIAEYPEDSAGMVFTARSIDCPPIAHISYSPETNVVFLSLPHGHSCLVLCRPVDLIAHGNGPFTKCTVIRCSGMGYSSSPEEFVFAAVHPTIPSIHFLQTVPPGRCAVLEFLDGGVCFQLIALPEAHGGSFLLLPLDDAIVGIAGGRVFELTAGRLFGSLACGFAEPQPSADSAEDGASLAVPPTFWANSLTISEGITVTDDEGNACAGLLHQSGQLFTRRKLGLTIRSQSRVIVGVQIDFGASRPSAVRVLNRRYALADRPRKRYQFPLTREEAFQRSDVRVWVETAGSQVAIDGIRVHTIIGKGRKLGLLDAEIVDLQDFRDPAIGRYHDQLDLMLGFLSGVEFDEAAEVDREAGVLLVKLMYQQPKIEVTCRRAILRAFRERSALMGIWADAIRQVCEERVVHEELVTVMWRDFSCLDPEYQAKVGPSIWKVGRDGGYALVSALLCLDNCGDL